MREAAWRKCAGEVRQRPDDKVQLALGLTHPARLASGHRRRLKECVSSLEAHAPARSHQRPPPPPPETARPSWPLGRNKRRASGFVAAARQDHRGGCKFVQPRGHNGPIATPNEPAGESRAIEAGLAK